LADRRGIIKKTEIATGTFTSYSYDFRNRLVEAMVQSAGGVIISTVDYVYDLFDRRIARVVSGQAMYTVYNGDNVWADYDASGAVTARYLLGTGQDTMLARWLPSGGLGWYLTDAVGTVRDITDGAGLVIVNHIEYDSFGQVLSQSNPAAGDRFLFTGREYDPILALYYYRARYYDPASGRFISQDPLRLASGRATASARRPLPK
jgi:RHS repeat-associated protein